MGSREAQYVYRNVATQNDVGRKSALAVLGDIVSGRIRPEREAILMVRRGEVPVERGGALIRWIPGAGFSVGTFRACRDASAALITAESYANDDLHAMTAAGLPTHEA